MMTKGKPDKEQIRSLIREIAHSRCFAAGRQKQLGKKCYRPKKHAGKHRYYL